MTFPRRISLLGGLVLLVLLLGSLARHHAPRVVAHIVEEALVQKAPLHADAATVRERFRALADSHASREDWLDRLLTISQVLEKVPRISEEDLDRLLSPESPE